MFTQKTQTSVAGVFWARVWRPDEEGEVSTHPASLIGGRPHHLTCTRGCHVSRWICGIKVLSGSQNFPRREHTWCVRLGLMDTACVASGKWRVLECVRVCVRVFVCVWVCVLRGWACVHEDGCVGVNVTVFLNLMPVFVSVFKGVFYNIDWRETVFVCLCLCVCTRVCER